MHPVWQCSVICCKRPPVVNHVNTKRKADAGLQMQGCRCRAADAGLQMQGRGLPQLLQNAKGCRCMVEVCCSCYAMQRAADGR
jgi:hypothetical protein